MSRKRATLLLAGVAALGVIVSACSSSGGSGGTSSPAGAAGTTAAVGTSAAATSAAAATKSTYTIGQIAGITGDYASSLGGTFKVTDAWVKWTNAHGGVNGHPVKVIMKDDAGVPSTGIAAAKSLLNDPKVMAIVSPASNTSNAWYQLAANDKIAVVGGTVWSNAYQTVPTWFPTGATQGGYGKAVLYQMEKSGGHKLATIVCQEVPACKTYADEFAKAAKTFKGELGGAQVVYQATALGTAPSYTSQCLAAKQAGADSMLVGGASSFALRIYSDCAQQGFHPLKLATSGAWDATWLKDSTVNGTQFVLTNFPYYATDTASQKEFHAALAQYEPGFTNSDLYNSGSSTIWAAFELWKAAMAKANLGDSPTRAQVVKAMQSLPPQFSVPGITPALTYNTSGNGGNPEIYCYFGGSIKNGKFVTTNGGNAQCPTNLGAG
jgi:branched-chain amino acid transport system substrate-binding protein